MKKITHLALLFLVCSFAQAQNLALAGTATASSIENGGTIATNVNDGNAGTRWASAFADPQWIAIDLGANYDIGQVVLKWEGAYGTAYQIQVSNDPTFTTYTTAFTTTTGNGGNDDITVNQNARYIRMYGTVRATVYGYSLWEFEVYAAVDPLTIATLSDLTVNGTTVAGFTSSTYNYNVVLPIGTTTVPTVVATKSVATATAVTTNAPALPGTTTVVVTSENGNVTHTYTINFTVIIAPVNQTFNLTFEPGTAGSNPAFWNVFENGSNPPLEVVANPNPSGVNTSPKVAKMIATMAQTATPPYSNPYAGTETQHGNIWEWKLVAGFTTTITIDVYKTVISDVGIKMVTATNGTVFQLLQPNTVVNAWETLTYNIAGFVSSGENNNIDQIIVFPDWQTRATESTTYFDNITWNGLKTKEAQPVLNVANFGNTTVKIYPNPTQNLWNITSSDQKITAVQIVDVIGKQVMTLTPNALDVSIDASTLPTGIYFAKIATELGTKSIKLIKN